MPKQQGEDSSEKSLTLCLLLNHALLSHPEQQVRIKSRLPAYNVGSLLAREVMWVTIGFTRHIFKSDNSEGMLQISLDRLISILISRESKKHRSAKGVGCLDKVESLKYKKAS